MSSLLQIMTCSAFPSVRACRSRLWLSVGLHWLHLLNSIETSVFGWAFGK